jgi:uncharacterized membrane protein (UPF0127 family)
MAALCLAGCDRPAASAPPAVVPDLPVATQAQPPLPTIKLWIGSKMMTAEVAQSDREQATGMMFRTNIPPDTGMIFIHPFPERASYWMTNCPLPLDAAYLGSDGTILEFHDFKANDATAVVSKTDDIAYVIETSKGWFASNHVALGTVVATEKGQLQQVFFPNR